MLYMNQANGCYANSFFFACFLHADDIMLLSPSVLGLQSIHHSVQWGVQKIFSARSARNSCFVPLTFTMAAPLLDTKEMGLTK